MNIDIYNGFFKGKKVLVTGHTGFKGSWLCIWLHELGAEVVGVSLDPYSERDNFVLSGIGNKIKADIDRKSTRLNSSHMPKSRMPSSA